MDLVVFRAIEEGDYPRLKALLKLNEVGITTLPKDEATLKKRIAHTLESFHHPSHEHACYYWFILEAAHSGEPLGVAAIETQVGMRTPFYAYKRLPYERHSPSLNLIHKDESLTLSTDLKGATELCTLFLFPSQRALGLGRFLSRARFLFLAQFQTYFNAHLIAELRGITDEKGTSAFWNALGRPFFHMSFTKADHLTLTTDKQFIADLLPSTPFYVCTLPKAAQAVIGRPHPHTQGALKILINEGFQAAHYIDIFDAGPILEAQLPEVKTVKSMRMLPVKLVKAHQHAKPALVANRSFSQFRASPLLVELSEDEAGVLLTEVQAGLLNVSEGQTVGVVLEG